MIYSGQRQTLLVFALLLIFIFTCQSSEAESVSSVTRLDQSPQQCNRDPSKGRLGPVGDPPPTKCVVGAEMQEGENAKYFDSLVQVNELGRTKVCDTAIPLNEKCEPIRAATVEYCDTVRSNASEGKINCTKISKDDSKSVGTVSKIIDYLSDTNNRQDYVARGLIEATQQSVSGATKQSSIRDPEGLLVPITDSEKIAPQLIGPTDRRIEGTQDALRALADFDPQDPQRLSTAKTLVEKAEANGVNPWDSVPTRMPGLNTDLRDVYRLTDEHGLQVNHYQRDPGSIYGGELMVPKTPDDLAKQPPAYHEIDPDTGKRYPSTIQTSFSRNFNAPPVQTPELPPSNFIARSMQTASNIYATTLSGLQNTVSRALQWLRGL